MSVAVAALLALTLAALGQPPWPVAIRDAAAATSNPVVADIQRHLATLGFDPGPADGVIGARTRAAIRRYQDERRLRVDGRASAALRDHLAAAVASRGSLPALPSVEVDTRADPGIVTAATALRPAPKDSAPEQRLLPEGTRVRVLALRGSWARVRAHDEITGWVRAGNLRIGEAPSSAPNEKRAGAGWMRRLTGWVGGSPTRREEPGAVTIGVRGLTPDDVRGARPDPLALRRLDDYAVSEAAARAHAAGLGLVSVAVAPGAGSGGAAGSRLAVTPPDPAGGPIGASDR